MQARGMFFPENGGFFREPEQVNGGELNLKPRQTKSRHPYQAAAFETWETPNNQTRRSTIIFLISAMALAGESPFGHAFAQFMIV